MAPKAGRDIPEQQAIVENLAWHGYRLNPDTVTVLRAASSTK